MGKNHRHKKRLKSEKSKTQLKTATKFLPKGQNVTNTEFKLKSIVIRSQLQQTTSDDGHRNLELKDVLSRLKHYNENMQVKACEDLDYMIKNNKNKLLGVSMSEVVLSIANFMQSKMPKARKAGLNLMNIFLKSFSSDEIEPHFYYFSVNLRCAMTHIDRNIQEDSIMFLDSFLTFVPTLMAKHSSQILPDALTLISKLKNDSELRRTVTVTLKSKFTSLGWRVLVFSRLHTYVEAIVLEIIPCKRKIVSDLENVTVFTDKCCQKAVFKPAEALFNPRISIIDYPWQEKENKNFIDQQFPAILPLLIETWLEAAPVRAPFKDITYLTEETAMLLNCIIRIFQLIWSYLNSKDREDKINVRCLEGEKLVAHLMKNFPYALINRPKQIDKTDKFLSLFVANDIKCVQENLLICYLYFTLYCNNPSKTKQSTIDVMVNYITDCLSKDYSDSKMILTYLMSILEHLLVDKAKVWNCNKMPISQILESAISLYMKGNLNQSNKYMLLKILASVSFVDLVENKYYKMWLEGLPELLLESSISEAVIHIMFEMCRKNNVAFLKGYLNQFLLILDHLPYLEVTETKDPDNVKLNVIDMLFYAPTFSKPLQWMKGVLAKNSPYWPRIQYNFCMRKEFNRD